MRRTLSLVVGLASLTFPFPLRAADSPGVEFHDGDRVVLIGDDLIERDQKYGYLETWLTLLNPDKNITFRNLGWSGDTVYGEARARFGTVAEGFQHLKEHVLALKPNVIVVGYGMAHSFDGEAGLPKFVSGLTTLLDTLAVTKARFLFLSPIAHQDLGRPLPNPTRHNTQLKLYCEAIAKAAHERNAPYLDLFKLTDGGGKGKKASLTDDGIHLTDAGHHLIAAYSTLELRARLPDDSPDVVQVGYDGKVTNHSSRPVPVQDVKTSPGMLTFRVHDRRLPDPPPPSSPPRVRRASRPWRELRVTGLPDGRWSLKIDGQLVATASAAEWALGELLSRGPDLDQVESLRRTINAKNLLYFHRWRPENETYLFGFRKYEQGNNAIEIPKFDPLVAEKEKEIARLRKLATHTYELIRETEAAR